MGEIVKALESAVQTLGLASEVFVRRPAADAEQIVKKARDTFVKNNPRVWWLSLAQPALYFEYPRGDGPQHLVDHIPGDEARCWFIPETEELEWPVYDAEVSHLAAILGECPFFEYYLVGKDVDWLIVENDHNQLVLARAHPDVDTSQTT